MAKLRVVKFVTNGEVDNTRIHLEQEYTGEYGKYFGYLDSKCYATERQIKNFVKKYMKCLKVTEPVNVVYWDKDSKKIIGEESYL